MIRPATEADIPRLIELGQAMHEESPEYRGISYDPEKVGSTLKALINGAGVIFAYERSGEIHGALAGWIEEFWFSREKQAGDFALFVDPEYRNGLIAVKLALAFHSWAHLLGARRVQMGITTGVHADATGRLYRSLGMQDSGLLFQKDFS